jgi:hypothetical protein
MEMIKLFCNDKVLLASMRALLEARTEIEVLSHWTSLPKETEEGSCRVIVFCERDRRESRAALCKAGLCVQEMQQCSGVLRSLFRLVLESEQPVIFAAQLAKRTSWHKSTLYEDWQRRIGDGASLKDFIDKVLLLRARRYKTPAVSWPQAAAECGTEKRHLQAISRRWMARWPGDRDGHTWIEFADTFRAEFALLVAPRARNA